MSAHSAVTEARVREIIREELDQRDAQAFRQSRFFGAPEQLEPHLGKCKGVES